MRKGLFFGAALVASMLFGGTAFADRADESTNSNGKPSRGREIKEQVLEKMKEGSSRNASRAQNSSRRENAVTERIRPKGDVYTDQGTRGSKTKATTSSGRNMSASNRVNTPREIKQMLKMINPLFGAYRTVQAAEGTDSYGGDPTAKGKSQDGRSRNMSNSNKVNTPSEIKQMLLMINPMYGAYRMAAGGGTDSYGGSTPASPGYKSSRNGTNTVHFKNDKGEVVGKATGDTGAAKRVKESREKMNDAIKAKMSKK